MLLFSASTPRKDAACVTSARACCPSQKPPADSAADNHGQRQVAPVEAADDAPALTLHRIGSNGYEASDQILSALLGQAACAIRHRGKRRLASLMYRPEHPVERFVLGDAGTQEQSIQLFRVLSLCIRMVYAEGM
jgi:hypothetical protein